MQKLEKHFSSLALCYVFLASVAAVLLIYARLELQANPPDWSNIIGGFIHGSNFVQPAKWAHLLGGARSALVALRERMHTTWLFFVVFAAVWLACLLWMEIERNRRGTAFSRREGYWILGFTLLVVAMAVLYGLGTNGILARRFPGIVPVSDVVAAVFLLALPLAAWSRLDRLQEEQEDDELYDTEPLVGRSRGFLGLNDDITNARLMESLSRLEVKPVDMHPTVQAFHSETVSEPPRTAAMGLVERMEDRAAAAPFPEPVPAAGTISLVGRAEGPAQQAESGIQGFRRNLAAMNESWSRIEAIRGEIDHWFERRRREAIERFEMHPGMRALNFEKSLLENFPNDKLAAVDSEWAEIRKAVFEIARWFGEFGAPDQSKSK